jgi:predicted kinase
MAEEIDTYTRSLGIHQARLDGLDAWVRKIETRQEKIEERIAVRLDGMDAKIDAIHTTLSERSGAWKFGDWVWRGLAGVSGAVVAWLLSRGAP